MENLELAEKRYEEINELLADTEVLADHQRLQSLSREQASLQEVVTKFRDYKKTVSELDEALGLLDNGLDSDMAAMAKEEADILASRRDTLLQELNVALLPEDTTEHRNAIVEIRAGTGGDEASLFAADLYRMYTYYAQAKRWEVEVVNTSESSRGGFKEIVFEVRGKGAFGRLKYERGVHRVQRVPITEASGRIHTSTATVAVLPEAEEVDIKINPEDIKEEFFHSGGPGGQNVNKVSTAVRLIHQPSGTVVVCQDERSQLQNRMKAMMLLRTRLFDVEERKRQEQISQDRRSQVGSGERSEKIRTYNFPQDRLTDHRIGLSLHNLPAILRGEIDPLIDALVTHEQSEKVAGPSES